MKPDAPIFEPLATQKRLQTFGWVSVPIDHPEAVVAKFCEENGLAYERFFFNWMLKPMEAVAETPEEKAQKFEKIRQDNLARRQKLAAARKKKAQTT